MAFILKNDNLEIQIDAPNENYNFSRFDWTGKIASVKFKNIPISGLEKEKYENELKIKDLENKTLQQYQSQTPNVVNNNTIINNTINISKIDFLNLNFGNVSQKSKCNST